MPITFLDLILLVVMLISAMLAMIRGFMREVLSIAAWLAAAACAFFFFSRLAPIVKSQFNLSDTIANVIAAAGLFLVTLLIVSVITVRISDMILDSRVGALDRTLGFLFGLGRGLIIVVVAFLFFEWLVQEKSQPTWVQSAKSKVVLQGTGNWLKGLLPDDAGNTILNKLKKPRGDDPDAPDVPPPENRSDRGITTGTVTVGVDPSGYGRGDRDGMRQLIEGRTATAR